MMPVDFHTTAIAYGQVRCSPKLEIHVDLEKNIINMCRTLTSILCVWTDYEICLTTTLLNPGSI